MTPLLLALTLPLAAFAQSGRSPQFDASFILAQARAKAAARGGVAEARRLVVGSALAHTIFVDDTMERRLTATLPDKPGKPMLTFSAEVTRSGRPLAARLVEVVERDELEHTEDGLVGVLRETRVRIYSLDRTDRLTGIEEKEDISWTPKARVLDGEASYEMAQEIVDKAKAAFDAAGWVALVGKLDSIGRGSLTTEGALNDEAVTARMTSRGRDFAGPPDQKVVYVELRQPRLSSPRQGEERVDRGQWMLFAERDGTPLRVEYRLERTIAVRGERRPEPDDAKRLAAAVDLFLEAVR